MARKRPATASATTEKTATLAEFASQEEATAFLRQANARLSRQLTEAKARNAELAEAVYCAARDAASSLAFSPIASAFTPREPSARRATKLKQQDETALIVVSDLQLAKTTPTYNTEICAQRMRRYAQKVADLTAIQRSDHPVRNARLYLLGDIVEGELIFPYQPYVIDSSLYKQVMLDGPQILGDFIRFLLSIFEQVHVVGVIGNHGCEQETARAITKDGFRAWHELAEGDEVLSVNDDGVACWQEIEEVIAYHHAGSMIRVKSRDVPICVTPDHRIVGKVSWNMSHWREWRANAVDITTVQQCVSALNTMPSSSFEDSDIQLAAWCLTDSHRDKKGYWHFYQRESKATRIRSLLGAFEHSEAIRKRGHQNTNQQGIPIIAREPHHEFHVHAGASQRLTALVPDRDHLPAWIWNLSTPQVEILLAEWVFTDGSVPRGLSNVCIYISKRSLREDLQRLLVQHGYCATASEYRPGHWRLNITKRQWTNVAWKPQEQYYDGIVWCLRVPNGRFFIEQHGKIRLTGNSIGGHQRGHHNPTTNADRMLYRFLAELFKGEQRVTFQIPDQERERGWYAVDYPHGRDHGFLLFHGDQIPGSSAHSVATVARRIYGWASGAVPEPFRYVIYGHWHTPRRYEMNRMTVWCNGSTESTNTWTQERFAEMAEPKQLLMYVHPRVGPTAEYWVKLSE